MRGHIRQRGKKWEFVIDLGRDEHGKRAQKWHTGFKRKKDAEQALAAALDGIAKNTYVAPKRETTAAFLREWIAGVGTTIRPSTLASYTMNVERHIIPNIGSIQLQRLSAGHLNAMYAHLMERGRADGKGGLSPQTVKYIAMVTKRALAEAVRWGRLTRNPADAAQPPRPRRGVEMKTWSGPQLRHFLDSVEGDPLHAAYVFAATTGARRGEVLGLRWVDLDLDAGRASITHTVLAVRYEVQFSTPKTAKGRRMISLDPITVDALRAHRKRQLEQRLALGPGYEDHDLVFADPLGRPTHPDAFSAAFNRHVKASGLPRVRLHDLRHTSASLMLAAGVPAKVASERLGHASVGITLDLYSHVTPGLQDDAAARIAASVFGT